MAGTAITTAVLLLAVTQAVMCNVISPKPKDFFPDVKGNLTKIVWAHAVNSKAELEAALSSDDIMMLEADVIIGNFNETDNSTFADVPIMAHPPAKDSDLSLVEFLNITIHHNGTKGIKLDFKSIEAISKSTPVLKLFQTSLKFPVFLNADIIPGPVNATATSINVKDFFTIAREDVPECTLSVGWTTRYGKEHNITEGRYDEAQIKMMTDAVTEYQVRQSITYPVRAGLAANDIETVKKLLNNTMSDDVTLTIWSSEGDLVNVTQLTKLIKDVGVDKVYLDVPDDLKKQLNLSNAATLHSAVALGILSALLSVFLL